MKKIFNTLKSELMLVIAVVAAAISLFITPPSKDLINKIDWHTLGTLFMMLMVLEGFKKENIFKPLINLAGSFKTIFGISAFLIFGVFFTSMFVTNDVSLIIFVPLTIMIFRAASREQYILPVISMENIAAIRGSLLMPFGSPQNLFIYGQSGVTAITFIKTMAPLCASSAIFLIIFIYIMCRSNIKEEIIISNDIIGSPWAKNKRLRRITYISLFILVIATIVSRTDYWPYVIIIVLLGIIIQDIKILFKVDYVLILTFLCFFIFSSSITGNEEISSFLHDRVSGHEYIWSILLSQLISNVPASIVLYPFSSNTKALLYGLDTAGLCSLIGSLASVINYRIYTKEYPNKGVSFIKVFTLISWAFLILALLSQLIFLNL